MTRIGYAQNGLCRGFSLAELLIALVCTGILIGAGAPNMIRLEQEWTLWGAVQALESSLQWGRMKAIASNAPVIFEVDPVRQEFYWRDALNGNAYPGSLRRLPQGIRFTAAPKRSLRFYQHGNAVPGGTYTVEGDAGSRSVIVSPGGRIRTQRN